MTTHRRPARHHYGTGSAGVIVATIFAAACALVLAAALTSRHAGPVTTGAPGPEVLRPPAASVQVTVTPDTAALRAAWHREHLEHLAHLAEWHADHVDHERHLAEEAGDGLT